MAPVLCVNDEVVKGKLISTIFFMSGIATLIQTMIGNRQESFLYIQNDAYLQKTI